MHLNHVNEIQVYDGQRPHATHFKVFRLHQSKSIFTGRVHYRSCCYQTNCSWVGGLMRVHKKTRFWLVWNWSFSEPKYIYVSDNRTSIYKRSLKAYPDSDEIKTPLGILDNLTLFFRNSGFVERAWTKALLSCHK